MKEPQRWESKDLKTQQIKWHFCYEIKEIGIRAEASDFNKKRAQNLSAQKFLGCTMKNKLTRAKTLQQRSFYPLITETLANLAQLWSHFKTCWSDFFFAQWSNHIK